MQHTKTKHIPIYDCEICRKGFSTPDGRDKHTRAKHQTSSSPSTTVGGRDGGGSGGGSSGGGVGGGDRRVRATDRR
jgi:hypothetical protein